MAGKYFIRLCAVRDTETCETDIEKAVEQDECVCSDVKADIKAHLAPFFFFVPSLVKLLHHVRGCVKMQFYLQVFNGCSFQMQLFEHLGKK